jgi:hypothetical protein
MLPVGMIIQDRAEEAVKQAAKLMGRAAFRANGKAA